MLVMVTVPLVKFAGYIAMSQYNNLVRDDFSVSGGEKMASSYENILDLRLTIPTVICRKIRFLTLRGDNSETMLNARVMKLKEFIAIASFNSILQLLGPPH